MFLWYSQRDKMATRKQTDIYTKVGERLRALRNRAGLSQAALGARLGRSASAIDRYEMGQRRLSLADLLRLSEILGISLEALAQNRADRHPPARGSERVAASDLLSAERLRAEHLRLLRELDRRLAYPAAAGRGAAVREEPAAYGRRSARRGVSPDAYAATLSAERLRSLARRAGWSDPASPEALRRFAVLILRAFARRIGREGR